MPAAADRFQSVLGSRRGAQTLSSVQTTEHTLHARLRALRPGAERLADTLLADVCAFIRRLPALDPAAAELAEAVVAAYEAPDEDAAAHYAFAAAHTGLRPPARHAVVDATNGITHLTQDPSELWDRQTRTVCDRKLSHLLAQPCEGWQWAVRQCVRCELINRDDALHLTETDAPTFEEHVKCRIDDTVRRIVLNAVVAEDSKLVDAAAVAALCAQVRASATYAAFLDELHAGGDSLLASMAAPDLRGRGRDRSDDVEALAARLPDGIWRVVDLVDADDIGWWLSADAGGYWRSTAGPDNRWGVHGLLDRLAARVA